MSLVTRDMPLRPLPRGHVAEGLISKRKLANMGTEVRPELTHRRFVYVSVSRASHDAQVFTNDASTRVENLSRSRLQPVLGFPGRIHVQDC